MEAAIRTGEIIPRDYGIVLRRKGTKTFVSPSKFAVGTLLLEKPEAIQRRIADIAQRTDTSIDEVTKALEKGIKRKREGAHILTDNMLFDARLLGNAITAKIISKSDPEAYHEVRIAKPLTYGDTTQYDDVQCSCSSGFWDGVKTVQEICPHIAALTIALYRDEKSRLSADENTTGLTPSRRLPAPSLPFAFQEKSLGWGKRDKALTGMLHQYYTGKKKHVGINKEALASPEIYSSWLAKTIQNQQGSATYEVVRQAEKTIDRDSLSTADRELYGASKALEGRAVQMLKKAGFKPAGYCLEFKGTPHEVVAQRFVNGFAVYSLCMRQDMPPFLVRKNLHGKAQNPITAVATRQDSPYTRKGWYESIDDATRRECSEQIIVPGTQKDSQINVPIRLQRKYASLMRQ
jgi:hypothetical protein